MRRAIERRHAERGQIIDEARSYLRAKATAAPIRAAYLVGSVARGDFNLWSDIDVVIVVDELPGRFLERVDLFSDGPPGVEVFPFTPEELESERRRGNPLVLEVDDVGIDLLCDGPH
ncbi:nucleotidyltransferase domain-containing protein [soil metagenome]